MQVLGDVLPGGKPRVSVLLPCLVVLLPGSRRKCVLHLKWVSLLAHLQQIPGKHQMQSIQHDHLFNYISKVSIVF